MKITKSQLKEIIKEEASRLKKQYILEDKKDAIAKELRMLNEDIKITNIENLGGTAGNPRYNFEFSDGVKIGRRGENGAGYDEYGPESGDPRYSKLIDQYIRSEYERTKNHSSISDGVDGWEDMYENKNEMGGELEMSDIDDMSIEDKAVFSAMNDEEVEDDLSNVLAKYANQGGDYEGGYKDDISVSPGYLSESNKKGKMKITKSQLKEIIKEEVSRLKKQYILEDKKKAITEELRMLNENLGEEEMEFLKTVKSTKPELYNKYINKVKRKGLEFAINDFYPHTEEGKVEARQQELQAKRDVEKQERLDDENQKIDEVLSMVSQKEMADYMAEWRRRMLDGEHVNDAPNKRFDREGDVNLALLAQAYIKAHGLDDSLISKTRIVWDDEDELSAFDDLKDFIRSARTQKLFDRKFDIKFRQIISEFL